MYAFKHRVHIESGQPLGGYAEKRLSSESCDLLELNGCGFHDQSTGKLIELCSFDSLYAGDLVDTNISSNCHRIHAASHTHYAPMLDSLKPKLGNVSQQAIDAWTDAIDNAIRNVVHPDTCTVYSSEVPIPIYRRFDRPDGLINRVLTRYGGMYPNENQPVDRNLYLIELSKNSKAQVVIAYHACHPVSRTDNYRTSPDYVGALRDAVRIRFGDVPCIYLQGCAGDVRPNIVRKRIGFLPRSRFNWRFKWPVPPSTEQSVDRMYTDAVHNASLMDTFSFCDSDLRVESMILQFEDYDPISFPRLHIGDRLLFDFIPFEVSHLYHLDAQRMDKRRFIVSCADRTLGYLPHPSQIISGGYEVDGSLDCMGLSKRVILKTECLW
jgi:hypothetical protein